MTGHTNPDEVDPDSVTTMDEVKTIYERLGFPAEVVGYLDDPHSRHDGGLSLSQMDDGRWRVAGYERGHFSYPEYFNTETEALRSLARSAVKMANNPKADLSPEELAELDATAGERRRKIEEDFDRWQKAEIERRARAAQTDDPPLSGGR